MLLLHPTDLLIDFGLFAALCAAALLLVNVLASRANRARQGRTPKIKGVNRAQRRKEGRRAGAGDTDCHRWRRRGCRPSPG